MTETETRPQLAVVPDKPPLSWWLLYDRLDTAWWHACGHLPWVRARRDLELHVDKLQGELYDLERVLVRLAKLSAEHMEVTGRIIRKAEQVVDIRLAESK